MATTKQWRFPSLSVIFLDAVQTGRRFPAAILAGTVAAGLLVSDKIVGNLWLLPATAISAAVLGALVGETLRHPKVAAPALSFVCAAVTSLILHRYSGQEQPLWYASLHLGLVLHLAIAVLPVRKFLVSGFWQYNRWLFVRFFFAQLFSSMLSLGLMAAAGAVHFLLFSGLPERIYMDIWVTIHFVFHPWFFLSALPLQLKQFDQERIYPKGLDLISRFLLLPLLTIYCVILYLYMGKIAVLQSLPKGGVAYLISGVSLLGILSFLFLQPRLHDEGGVWVKLRKLFFLILVPLLALLFMGLFVRIDEYGLTTNRYLVALFAFWSAGMTLYFLVSNRPDIRLIPVTLAAVALVSLGGPWSVYRLPPRLQFARLEKILVASGALAKGKIVGKVTAERRVVQRAASALETVLYSPERQLLQPWFPDLTDLKVSTWARYGEAYDTEKAIQARLGIETAAYSTSVSIQSGRDRLLRLVQGFDYVVSIDSVAQLSDGSVFPKVSLDKESINVDWSPSARSRFLLKPWWEERAKKQLDAGIKKEIIFEAEDKLTKLRLFIAYASFEIPLASFRINNLAGQALLKRKP